MIGTCWMFQKQLVDNYLFKNVLCLLSLFFIQRRCCQVLLLLCYRFCYRPLYLMMLLVGIGDDSEEGYMEYWYPDEFTLSPQNSESTPIKYKTMKNNQNRFYCKSQWLVFKKSSKFDKCEFLNYEKSLSSVTFVKKYSKLVWICENRQKGSFANMNHIFGDVFRISVPISFQ